MSTSRGKNLAAVPLALLVVQISLGAASVWTERDPLYTTAHVIVGATLLAATFLVTWLLHRDAIEAPATRDAILAHSPRTSSVARS